MKRIGLLSDTHGFLDPKIFHHFEDCHEVWHAGDFGDNAISDQLSEFKILRGVYGNIDGIDIRSIHPLTQLFHLEGVKIRILHIGGYPGRYPPALKKSLKDDPCDIFICGHSHILKIMKDPELGVLTINPGAAGKHGFHLIRTIMKFDLANGKIENMKVIELGKRS
jgi:putative phosphoesterase